MVFIVWGIFVQMIMTNKAKDSVCNIYCKLPIRQASRARSDYPTFDTWYRKALKKVFPVLLALINEMVQYMSLHIFTC